MKTIKKWKISIMHEEDEVWILEKDFLKFINKMKSNALGDVGIEDEYGEGYLKAIKEIKTEIKNPHELEDAP